MSQVFASIDGSAAAPGVCDYAAWASQRLQAPLTLLHILDRTLYPQAGDLSGTIGLGSREHLLTELAALDQQRSKVALEEGRIILQAAHSRVQAAGISEPMLRQRHGDLIACLSELENEMRLLVIGRQGERSASTEHQVGGHLESVIRTLHKPILVAGDTFTAPQQIMLAFDGSATAHKSVEMLADSPLIKGLPCHLVMVGADSHATREQLKTAQHRLLKTASEVHLAIVAGEVEPALHAYQAEHNIDLLAMGAYGHSRIRQFFVGSTTTNLLRSSTSALLILR